MKSRNNNNLKGIDISNWQSDVDMKKVKGNGIDIVYCKATESDFYKDKYAKQNYNNAKANGLKVGFYHFFRGDTNPKVQANFFINYLKEIGAMNFDCKLALDIESAEGVGAAQLTTMCIEFLEEVKRLTGKEVVVYTYTSFANTNLDSRLSKYPVWIAHYGVNTPGGNPIWSEWVGFQYSSSGSVAGVNGNCDMNEFTEDILLDKVVDIPIPPVDAGEYKLNSYSENGIFTCTVDAINFRNNPLIDKSNPIQGQYFNDENVSYDYVYISNLYTYISWVSGSSIRRYMPITDRTTKEKWGYCE